MPHMHLHDLWTNTCGLVSRCGTCFWDGSVMHVQRSVKSVRRKAKHTYYVEFENVSVFLNAKTTTCFICFPWHCCSLVLIILDADFTVLWLHFTLSSPPFSCQAPSSFFLTPITIFAIWCRDNESASAATALRTINLRKWDGCLRTSHTFNCIPDHDKFNS